jgi:hypothetical protein
MLHPILTMPNGVEIYIDLIKSKAARSIARQPQLLGLIKEALKGKSLTGPEMHIEQDMGRVVGYDFIITTKDGDAVFYAKLINEQIYTRFVKTGKALSTQFISLALESSADGKAYEVQSARIGPSIPPRPGTSGETAASKRYWETHAVMQEGESLQLKTLSKKCPY